MRGGPPCHLHCVEARVSATNTNRKPKLIAYRGIVSLIIYNQSHDPAIARQVTKVEAIGADGNATDAPSGGAWRKAAELLMGTD